jgi:hypothetical protein
MGHAACLGKNTRTCAGGRDAAKGRGEGVKCSRHMPRAVFGKPIAALSFAHEPATVSKSGASFIKANDNPAWRARRLHQAARTRRHYLFLITFGLHLYSGEMPEVSRWLNAATTLEFGLARSTWDESQPASTLPVSCNISKRTTGLGDLRQRCVTPSGVQRKNCT